MPPRILALMLTLVQSNKAILIGSFDSTACAVMGVSAVAARAARPNKALVTRSLFMMSSFLAPVADLVCRSIDCPGMTRHGQATVNAKPHISWKFVDLREFDCHK